MAELLTDIKARETITERDILAIEVEITMKNGLTVRAISGVSMGDSEAFFLINEGESLPGKGIAQNRGKCEFDNQPRLA